jgi:hypothetical protein
MEVRFILDNLGKESKLGNAKYLSSTILDGLFPLTAGLAIRERL